MTKFILASTALLLTTLLAVQVAAPTFLASAGGVTAIDLLAASPAERDYAKDVAVFAGTGSHGAADGHMAQFNMPLGLAALGDGYILVADSFNNLIRKVDKNGYATTLAGSLQGPDSHSFPQGGYHDDYALLSLFYRPTGLAINSEGWIFIADMYNHAIRVIIEGEVYTFAGGLGMGYENGYYALFNRPGAIAFDENGYLFVADTGNHVIRKISPDGYASTVAGTAGVFGFLDGKPGEALFDSPMGLAFSEEGVLFIADAGNNLIRKLQGGEVSTFAGNVAHMSSSASGQAADMQPGAVDVGQPGSGNVGRHASEFIGQSVALNVGLYDDEFFTGGFADGAAYEAMFNHPIGLAFWQGLLFVADSQNHSIRIVDNEGNVSTLAGTGYPDHISGSFDEAAFHFPAGIIIVVNRLFVADMGNNMIRVIELENKSTGGAF